jgi:preprotein translocase subunit SecD
MAKHVEEPPKDPTKYIWRVRLAALLVLILGSGIGWFVYNSEERADSRFHFKLGLDLIGGTHLVYKADIAGLPEEDVDDSLDTLRDVIERRTNLFGVSEPLVQRERSSFVSGTSEERLIVELPGITDIGEAVRIIGETPLLEFKLVNEEFLKAQESDEEGNIDVALDNPDVFIDTGLTGRFLERATLEFGSPHSGTGINEPLVVLTWNSEGKELFADITKAHVNERMAIFLDGQMLSDPVIREAITGGEATISGGFTGEGGAEEARNLVQSLNLGALPVPIELISTQSVGATLGAEAVERGAFAGLVGLGLVGLFMVLWYRAPGVLAVVSLAIYLAIMLAIFKLVPVVLTAAGIAGLILSIGMAVDANVLIFERMKEELRERNNIYEAARIGFVRAWTAIRDGNVTSILSAIILFWFGTSFVEGFALVFGVGVMVSMFTAITVTRSFLFSLGQLQNRGIIKYMFGSGAR